MRMKLYGNRYLICNNGKIYIELFFEMLVFVVIMFMLD